MKIHLVEHIEGGVAMQFEIPVSAEPVRERTKDKEPSPPRFPHRNIACIYQLMAICVGCAQNHEHPCGGIKPTTEELISRIDENGNKALYLTCYAIVNRMNGEPVDGNIVNLCPAAKIIPTTIY